MRIVDYMRFVAVAALLAFAMVAHADEDRARARALFESGMAHYNLGELKEALADFKESYRLTRDPANLFNIAQCYRRMQQPAQAADVLRAFRRESPDAPNREMVERLIDELDRQAKEHPTSSAAPATPAPQSAPALTSLTARAPEKPVYKRRWFWGVVAGGAVVVVGGVVLAAVLGAPRPPVATAGSVNGN